MFAMLAALAAAAAGPGTGSVEAEVPVRCAVEGQRLACNAPYVLERLEAGEWIEVGRGEAAIEELPEGTYRVRLIV